MDELLLVIRIFLSTLFVSTAVSKFANMKSHIMIISEYEILPIKWSKKIAWLDSILEFIIGILLFIGYLQSFAFFSAILLFIIYCYGISINLIRGRKNISCGCGGITGDHKLSWLLVVRNIIFILITIFIWVKGVKLFSLDTQIQLNSIKTFFTKEYIPIILSTWLIIALIVNILELIKFNFEVKKYE